MLYEEFLQVAKCYGAKVAIEHEKKIITYTELQVEVNNLIGSFLELPKESGHIFGIYLNDPIEFITCYIAASAIGFCIVPIDTRYSVNEIQELITECELDGIVYNPIEQRDIETVVELKKVKSCVTDNINLTLGQLHKQNGTLNLYQPTDFIVQYTSGSTGKPKAIVLSNSNIVARVKNWSDTIQISSEDTILCSLTLAHSHGTDVLLLPGLLSGAKVITPNLLKITPNRIFRFLAEKKVTVFSSLPYMYELIISSVAPDRFDISSVRYFISGSAPLSNTTAIAFEKKFGVGICQVYGLSEIGPICFNSEYQQVGYIGSLVKGVEAKVVDDNGNLSDTGELVVKGVSLARGYLKSSEDQAKMFKDGWLWTKDIVKATKVGMKILGRKSRFINTGGNKVDPKEIENTLKLIHGVNEVVVLGQKDPLRGEKIIAFVQKSNDTQLTEDEIRCFVKQRLASYKIPESIKFVEHIPRSTLGKIQISKLQSFLEKA